MLNWLGIWASSKGMVRVPDLSGLNQAQSITSLQNSGLNYELISTPVSTSNISLNGLLESQYPTAGTLVGYESSVTIRFYL